MTITLKELVGAGEREFGTSKWVTVDQRQIDLFAEATGDHQWIHIDPEAAKAGPFGGTIAHGYLSLSLLPVLLSDVIDISDQRMGVNYGIDRVRFTSPVPSGSDVRAHATLISAEPKGDGIWDADDLLAELRERFPSGAQPLGMVAAMAGAGGQSQSAVQ